MATPSTLTHITAQELVVDGRRMRQRCAWCGAVIVDYDLALVSAPVGQPGPSCFAPGVFVQMFGTFPAVSQVVEDPHDGKYPKDSCMAIEDEVTR